MKTSSTGRLVLAAVLVMMVTTGRDACAELVVQFSTTIEQSIFMSGDLAVGGTIVGQYAYDPVVAPFERGSNVARYRLLRELWSAGTDIWTSENVVLTVAHSTGIELPDGTFDHNVDFYNVTGFGPLLGPPIQGFAPLFADLFMIDTDASVYTDMNLPVAFPDPSLFEFKTFRFGFLVPGQIGDVGARIDSIDSVPEPSSLALACMTVPVFLWVLLRKRRPHR